MGPVPPPPARPPTPEERDPRRAPRRDRRVEVSQRKAQLKSELKSTCVHPRSRGAESETMVKVRPRKSTRRTSSRDAPAVLMCRCFAGTSWAVMSTIVLALGAFDPMREIWGGDRPNEGSRLRRAFSFAERAAQDAARRDLARTATAPDRRSRLGPPRPPDAARARQPIGTRRTSARTGRRHGPGTGTRGPNVARDVEMVEGFAETLGKQL